MEWSDGAGGAGGSAAEWGRDPGAGGAAGGWAGEPGVPGALDAAAVLRSVAGDIEGARARVGALAPDPGWADEAGRRYAEREQRLVASLALVADDAHALVAALELAAGVPR